MSRGRIPSFDALPSTTDQIADRHARQTSRIEPPVKNKLTPAATPYRRPAPVQNSVPQSGGSRREQLRPFLFSRVMLLKNQTKALSQNVRVDLCRRNIGMTQHGLQTPEIRSALQKMCSEAVAHHVRCKPLPNTGFFPVKLQQLPEALPRHARRPGCHEQISAGPSLQQCGAAGGQVLLYCTNRLGAQRDHALLPPFAHHPTTPSSRFNAASSTEHSSDTRTPVAYKNWSMARSRTPLGSSA